MISSAWHWVTAAGRPMQARLGHWRAQARRILATSDALQTLSDEALVDRSRSLRGRAQLGTPLRELLPEAYALVRETARRVHNTPHYLEQIIGGIALFEGGLAEMQTGEGKTLTATFPAYLRALTGHGCHVITVNDYLAERDATDMGLIFQRLGVTVGCVRSTSTPEERRAAYRCDITYATGREVGFDFLRDRLQVGAAQDKSRRPQVFGVIPSIDAGTVQRELHYALVDEADSVLIDDAGTPLIIASDEPCTDQRQALLDWCHALLPHLKAGTHFHFRPQHRAAELTIAGCRSVLLHLKPAALNAVDAEQLYHRVEQALRAEYGYQRDRDYIVREDAVAIVDESTGRILEGRRWQEGLHQAVEAKEHVPPSPDMGEAARITVQTFFRRYRHLAGMTGTARAATREFRRTYRLQVTCVPTHRPCRRQGLRTRVFVTQAAKFAAIAESVRTLVQEGRAVLIGTPSVAASVALKAAFRTARIPTRVLNALQDAKEARLVARAGQPKRVTIATNMAGRGTDIKLHDDVRNAGGLHVVATELHSSRRIDRQLIGRCARQGDPGTYQFFVSLEDELFRGVPPKTRVRWLEQARPNAHSELPRSWLRVFRRVQRNLECQAARNRNLLLRQESQRTDAARKMGLDAYLEWPQ
jgi:preprotein translocase subunit SecA